MKALISFALFMVLLSVVSANGKDSSGYWNGRATFYTDNTQGSCHYGAPDNAYYAAWPNGQEGAPQCGKCFEVSCVNSDFKDGYGQATSRSNACLDESKKVVVKIIDSCPCVHENFYSNQRWCCGDMDHIDLSAEVFKMLADPQWGVIGAKFKEASCDHLGLVTGSQDSAPDNKGSSGQVADKDSSAPPVSSKQPEDSSDSQAGSVDDSWIKDKVSSWGHLSTDDFDKRWQDMMDNSKSLASQAKSKLKFEKPDWVKSMFSKSGWRR